MKKFVYKYVVGHTFQNGIVKNVWEQKEFDSQADLFEYLVVNKSDIIEQRKSIDKHCEGGLSMLADANITSKSALFENDEKSGILKRTVLMNTYWWMDTQSDVLLGSAADGENAVFTNSIKGALSSRKGAAKVPPIDQHNFSLDGRIGTTLNLFEDKISWRALGIGKTGMTQGAFADAQIERAKNEARYNDYLNNEIDQHSVGMRYIDIQLAVNDPEEYPKEYAVFEKYIQKIGNRKEVEAQGFFFAVGEGALKEYSAVIAGANELTPVIQPSGGTGKGDSSGDSQDKFRSAILKLSSTILTT